MALLISAGGGQGPALTRELAIQSGLRPPKCRGLSQAETCAAKSNKVYRIQITEYRKNPSDGHRRDFSVKKTSIRDKHFFWYAPHLG